MALAVDPPVRQDLSLRTNNDTVLGYRWLGSDGSTPVPILSATCAFRLELPPTEYDPVTGEPLPPPAQEEHAITSTTPGDPDGWIDADPLSTGSVVVHVVHDIWASFEQRRGVWDVVAIAASGWRCLARGQFCVEEGIASS